MTELVVRVSEVLSVKNYKQADPANLLGLYKEVFGIQLSLTCPNCAHDAWIGLKHWLGVNERMNCKMNLFTSWYQDSSPARQKEMDFCLKYNRSSGYFDNVIVVTDKRPTYNDFFELTKKYPQDVNVIANSDIFFDHTISMAKQLSYTKCYALSRWDLTKDKTIEHHKRLDSQDVWIFRGTSKCFSGDFFLGLPGCDNRIAYELKKHYIVTNPSISIRPIHYHLTQIHNYTAAHTVPQPYAMVEPCQL